MTTNLMFTRVGKTLQPVTKNDCDQICSDGKVNISFVVWEISIYDRRGGKSFWKLSPKLYFEHEGGGV